MKGYKLLTLKEIKKRHAKNSQDKELHKIIENKIVNKKTFNKLIEQSTKQEAFDRNKK